MRRQRVVTVDLETVPSDWAAAQLQREPDESDEAFQARIDDLALSPRTGRVLVACAKSGDREPVDFLALDEYDERSVLTEVWRCIRRADLLVTFNGLTFDVQYLLVRSALLDVAPTRPVQPLLRRYTTSPHFDVRAVLTNWDRYARGTKAEWAASFGLPPQEGSGADVARWHREGAHHLVVAHCRDDVNETFTMYTRLRRYFDPRAADEFDADQTAKRLERAAERLTWSDEHDADAGTAAAAQ